MVDVAGGAAQFGAGVLAIALLGAVLGLDVVSFPQAMISRPIVAATVGGAMAGDVASGLLCGVVLELLAIETMPFGASRYLEWGSASVVGGALFASHRGVPVANAPAPEIATLVPAVVAALATGYAGSWSMIFLRRLNGRWAKSRLAALASGSPGAVVGLQLKGLTADLLRGGTLTALGLVVFTPVVSRVHGAWHLDAGVSRAILLGAAAAVAGHAVWRIYHGTPGVPWFFLGGLVLGLIVVLAL